MLHPSNHYSNLSHTPFDGSEPLFKIGLKPFLTDDWLDFDDKLHVYLAEKQRLFAEMPDNVFQAEEGTFEAQTEVLEIINAHLATRKITVPEVEASLPPLLQAAMRVQDDLVIMRKSDEGWRLVAGSVSFPSSWSLEEKFGMALHEVHTPVPGFNKGTRNAGMIERIFDNLQVGVPAERFNWSVYNDDALYHDDRSGEQTSAGAQHFLRVERQTLSKLSKSGDILFTIRIYIDPLDALKARNDRAEIAAGFIELLNALNTKELIYKGLDEGREVLITRLKELVDVT